MEDEREAMWAQQEGEGSQAYAAFGVYCELGARRSLKRVAAQCGIREAVVRRWSRAHAWRERVRAYDREQEQQAAAAAVPRWRERMAAEVENEWLAAEAMMARGNEMLASSVEATRWTWRDAILLIDHAAKVARLALAAGLDSTAPADVTVRVEYVNEADGAADGASPVAER